MSKILIVGNANYPTVKQRGLIGQAFGHEIHWVSAHPSPHPQVRSYCLPDFARDSKLWRAVLEPLLISRVIRKVQPDLVHVHHASKLLSVFPLSRFHPLIVSVMGSDIMPDQAYRGMYAPFIHMLLENADRITYKTDYMAAALQQIGDYQHKSQRISWGVDLDRFRPDIEVGELRKQYNILDSEMVFFDPRAATPFYNKHIILEAFGRYQKSGAAPAHLLVAELAGDPQYVQQLKARVRELQLVDRVHFLDAIPYEIMPAYYALADVTVSVPPSDGLPQSLYEALACGSFHILGDLPQYKEAIQEGISALSVPVGDVDALAKAMRWTAQQSDLQQQTLKAGNAYVSEYANAAIESARMNALYTELLN